MAGFVHGKGTKITVDGDDISAYTNTSEHEKTGDSHDVTTYGKSAHVKAGGLLDGKFTAGGVYETKSTATSPAAVLTPIVGTVVEIVRQPEGTGTGKPTATFDALITKYVETAPVADMVSWSMEAEVSDAVAYTTQS